MSRRSFPQILAEVRSVLLREGDLSIRQVALRTNTQWRTARNALTLLQALGVVTERPGRKTRRLERRFRLT